MALSGTLLAQSQTNLEFEPKVGAVGARVLIKGSLAQGTQVRFGGRLLTLLPEANGASSFIVPPGSTSSFIEAVRGGAVVGKSAVPFVVSGPSLGSGPKLIGLKEAIDVFAYVDPMPEGGGKPEEKSRSILQIGGSEVLTIGEAPPPRFVVPAVELHDAASAATQGMGPSLFNLTARPPRKKTPTPD